MKKFYLLLTLIIATALVFAPICPSTKTVRAAEPPPIPASMYYRAYDRDGKIISAPSDLNTSKESGTYITRNATYGTFGTLSFNITNEEIFEIWDIQIELPDEYHAPNGFPDIETPGEYGDMWYFGGVGVYKITVFAGIFVEAEEPEEGEEGEDSEWKELEPIEYFFVCKSAAPAFKASFEINKEATISYYSNFRGDIVLNLDPSANYQKPKDAVYQISDVEIEGGFTYQTTDNGLVIKVKSKPKSGTYLIALSVTYEYYEVDDDGNYTEPLPTATANITASVVFVTPPYIPGILDVLAGVGVLALLGGVLYGISYFSRQIQERQQ